MREKYKHDIWKSKKYENTLMISKSIAFPKRKKKILQASGRLY